MDAAGTPSTLSRVARDGEGEVLLVGLTPPRQKSGADGIREEAAQARERLDRLNRLNIDAAAVYDLTDEKGRDGHPRPFAYSPTVDPAEYVEFVGGATPFVVYRNVGKYAEDDLLRWMNAQPHGAATVFVGAGSAGDDVATSLPRAYELRSQRRPDLLLGAVAIPERHASKGDEPARLLRKQESGVSFFVTQIVYDLSLAHRLVFDYARACGDTGRRPAPIVFTLSLCGSAKQVDLLSWLGVRIPADLDRDLRRADDTLALSVEHCRHVARELIDTCRGLGVPFGFDVEAVAGRPHELDARDDLLAEVADMLRRP